MNRLALYPRTLQNAAVALVATIILGVTVGSADVSVATVAPLTTYTGACTSALCVGGGGGGSVGNTSPSTEFAVTSTGGSGGVLPGAPATCTSALCVGGGGSVGNVG